MMDPRWDGDGDDGQIVLVYYWWDFRGALGRLPEKLHNFLKGYILRPLSALPPVTLM